jgi:hypothetical protein
MTSVPGVGCVTASAATLAEKTVKKAATPNRTRLAALAPEARMGTNLGTRVYAIAP